MGPLSAQVEKAWVVEYGFTTANGSSRACLPGVYRWIGNGISNGNGGRKREVYGGQSINIHERWNIHRRIASPQRFHSYMRDMGLSKLEPKDGVSGVMTTPTGNATNRTLVECILNVALGINSMRRWRRRLSLKIQHFFDSLSSTYLSAWWQWLCSSRIPPFAQGLYRCLRARPCRSDRAAPPAPRPLGRVARSPPRSPPPRSPLRSLQPEQDHGNQVEVRRHDRLGVCVGDWVEEVNMSLRLVWPIESLNDSLG